VKISDAAQPGNGITETLIEKTDVATPLAATTQALGYVLRWIVPTVLRFGGLRVVIYPNDHRPAHVHVMGQGCEAVFNLNCPRGELSLRNNYGFPRRIVSHIEIALNREMPSLCTAWERFHDID
jgi:hypothetical protein